MNDEQHHCDTRILRTEGTCCKGRSKKWLGVKGVPLRQQYLEVMDHRDRRLNYKDFPLLGKRGKSDLKISLY